MTGIFPQDTSLNIAPGDTVEVRYRKARAVARQFAPVQIGFTLFEKDPEGDQDASSCPLLARTFNFFVFPNPVDAQGPDGRLMQHTRNFSVDAGSLDFLRSNGCDFGRWITKGVTYVNKDLEDKLRKHLGLNNKGHKDGAEEPAAKRAKVVVSNDHDVKWLDTATEQIKKFVETDIKELKLPSGNGFQILALRQHIEEHYPDMTVEKRKGSSGRRWDEERFLTRYTAEERQEREEELRQVRMAELDKRLGLRHIWSAVAQSGLPVVLHNGVLDLFFTLQHVGFDLPETLDEFRDIMSLEFKGTWYDTKLIYELNKGSIMGCNSSGLGDLYEALIDKEREKDNKPVKITQPAPFDAYTKPEAKYHEAGYDALCTGTLFAHFRNRGLLEGRANQLFMMRSMFTFNPQPCESDTLFKPETVVFRVYGFDKALKTDHFFNILSPITKERRDLVYINWIDDTSLFLSVAKSKEEQLDKILSEYSDEMKVESYESFMERTKAAAKGQTMRKRSLQRESSSPRSKRAKTN